MSLAKGRGHARMARTPKLYLDLLHQITADHPVAQAEALTTARKNHTQRVRNTFADPNIIGAGVAEKISAGKDAGTMSLVFYVRKKLAKADLNPDLLVPPVIVGANNRAVFTDVIEIGDIVAQATLPLNQKTPLKSGYSIGGADGATGTLGAIVSRAGKLFALSNSHVIASSGTGTKGGFVTFPGGVDGGNEADRIAKLKFFKAFKPGNGFVNLYDAALAELIGPQNLDIDFELFGAKRPLKIADPVRGMKVMKRGRTTGETHSIVRDIDFLIQVNYPGYGVFGFTKQVRCDSYTKTGDSGAIVIAKDSGAIVGIHFAGSAQGSVFTPIRTVIEALKFKFISRRV